MNRQRSHAQAGFTLIELLLAVAIMSMILVFVYGALRSIQQATDRVTGGRPRERAARIVLDRLERELSGAILMPRVEDIDPLLHPWVFYGVDQTIDGENADRLRFVTQTPLRAPGQRHGLGVRMVTYAMELDDAGLPALWRKEEPLPDELEKAIDLGDAQIVARDVHSFDLAYAGEGGIAERWDSTGLEQNNLLPGIVDVTVRLWERDANGERVPGTAVQRSIELPTRPEFLQPREQATTASCEAGASVGECREALLPLLKGSALESDVANLFARVQDACWDPDEPSDPLWDLRDKLEIAALQTPELDENPNCPVKF